MYYDISLAFEAIENELIQSMIRNMSHHKAEETKEGYNWSQWQVEQLKALERYKKDNQKRYKGQFQSINNQIEDIIRTARQTGGMQQEIKILQAIKKGYKVNGKNQTPRHDALTGEFFKLNDRKLDALMKATRSDMEKAETAILRRADDHYRKAIFNAQVYANSGSGTYEKAVDMATKDMRAAGLTCIEYANGARHTLADYADMAIRTASKRAYLQGEGEKRKEWGISLVIVNKRGNPCQKCLPFVGVLMIDDVWSGGSPDDGDYPLMSWAVSRGLYHPRCKDSHTTYFDGISEPPERIYTRQELKDIAKNYDTEQKRLYVNRQAAKYKRMTINSLSDEDKKKYGSLEKQWSKRSESAILDIIDGLPPIDTLQSNSGRESFANKLIDSIGIDKNGIAVHVSGINARGHCSFVPESNICNYQEYALQSSDDRSSNYKAKTAFHEAYHLSLQGNEWDAIGQDGNISQKWRDIEETFAETAAHYAARKYGITENLSPSYPDVLVRTLPRMKQISKFKDCVRLEDFGLIAWQDRLTGKGGIWSGLHDMVSSVPFNEAEYYKGYLGYITRNYDDLIDKMIENSPGYEAYKEEMTIGLKSAVTNYKNSGTMESLSKNEIAVFTNALINAMQAEGIR